MSIAPHGGSLVDRVVTGEARERLVQEAGNLPRIDLEDRQVSDLDMIAVGAMSPLTGFMGEKDYQSVVRDIRLADGTPWPFPMGLRVTEDVASAVKDRAALHAPDGTLLAVLEVSGAVLRATRRKRPSSSTARTMRSTRAWPRSTPRAT